MAASSSSEPAHPGPEVTMAEPSQQGEQEKLPLPRWDPTAASEYREKYTRYRTSYARRLKSKYFSKKTLDGEEIFDQETNVEGEIIKAGRWPCTRSFLEQSPARKIDSKKSG